MRRNQLEYINQKIMEFSPLLRQLNRWRLLSDKIVFTNGCFDILHRGHIEYLASAADFGNRLIIGLNSDSSVKKLKGQDRPVNTQADRALALASLHFVDAVVVFEAETPLELIKAIKPQILVKGGDYTLYTVVGTKEVESYGGKLEIIPFTKGYSTTGLLNKLKNSGC